jgi:hypothetical protein
MSVCLKPQRRHWRASNNATSKRPSKHTINAKQKRVLRTVGRLKAPLLYNKQTAFIGATLCGINHLHGYAVRLSSV